MEYYVIVVCNVLKMHECFYIHVIMHGNNRKRNESTSWNWLIWEHNIYKKVDEAYENFVWQGKCFIIAKGKGTAYLRYLTTYVK